MRSSITDLADTVAAINEELESLPDKAEDIANLLRKLGIKGASVSGLVCPLATYLKGRIKLPKDVRLFVGHDDIEASAGKFSVYIELPPGPRDFVRKVTLTGKYADLVVG